MKLELIGHEDRYAIEQLQMALFPRGAQMTEDCAVSQLHRGNTWLTAVTKITVDGKTTQAVRRMKAADETVRLRRRILQQIVQKVSVQDPDSRLCVLREPPLRASRNIACICCHPEDCFRKVP